MREGGPQLAGSTRCVPRQAASRGWSGAPGVKGFRGPQRPVATQSPTTDLSHEMLQEFALRHGGPMFGMVRSLGGCGASGRCFIAKIGPGRGPCMVSMQPALSFSDVSESDTAMTPARNAHTRTCGRRVRDTRWMGGPVTVGRWTFVLMHPCGLRVLIARPPPLTMNRNAACSRL